MIVDDLPIIMLLMHKFKIYYEVITS